MAFTAIDDPSAYFKVQLYTGDGNDSRTITFDDTDTDMQPDMIWIKERSSTSSHYLTSIGMGIGTRLEVDGTSTEATEGLSAVTSDGFTIGTSTNQVNQDTITHVAWCWKESATAGFDIVTWTGDDTARTLAHSLSAVPEFIMLKQRSGTRDWATYHASTGNGQYMNLNANGGSSASSTHWNSTTPTSSVFSVGTSNQVNEDTETYVGYLFAPKQGFSAMGSYTGNGNADGPFIYTGFRPSLVITKMTDGSDSWLLFDNKRLTYNTTGYALLAHSNIAELTGYPTDILSNGFKFRTAGASPNQDGKAFIYIAFAEAPFVNSNGVPCNAR